MFVDMMSLVIFYISIIVYKPNEKTNIRTVPVYATFIYSYMLLCHDLTFSFITMDTLIHH